MSESKFSLSTKDIQRLRDDYLIPFRDAKKAQRAVVVKEAYTTLIKNRTILHVNRSMVKQSVKQWLYNHGRRIVSKDKVAYVRKWTLNRVVGQLRKAEVDQACRDKSGATSGATTYLAKYQKVLKSIVDNLSADEREQYEKTALDWNQKAPPADVQRKTAEERGGRYVKEFAQQMHRRLGMRVFILSAHTDTKGAVCIASHDFNDRLGGDSFDTIRPDWETGDILEEWGKYAHSQLDPNHDDDGHDMAATRRSRKKAPVELETDADGRPLLPDPDEGKGLELRAMAPIVRSYITAYYRLASGKTRLPVPWASILDCIEDYISPDYLPTDTKLKEPSKLTKAAAHSLLKFWYDRQKDSKCPVPFAFHAVRSKDGTLEAVDIPHGPISSSRAKVGADLEPDAHADDPSWSEGRQDDEESSRQVAARRRPKVPAKKSKVVKPLPFSSTRHNPITGRITTGQQSRKRPAEDISPSPRPDKKKKQEMHNVISGMRRSSRQQGMRVGTRKPNSLDVKEDEVEDAHDNSEVEEVASSTTKNAGIPSGNGVRRSTRNKA